MKRRTSSSSARPSALLVTFKSPKGGRESRRITGRATVGRGSDCDIQIDAALVSRVHASLQYQDGSWWVIDEQSTNGVYADGKKRPRVEVVGTVEVHLGKSGPVITLQLENEASPAKGRPPQQATDARKLSDHKRSRPSHDPPKTSTEQPSTTPDRPSPVEGPGSDGSENRASGQRRGPESRASADDREDDPDVSAEQESRAQRSPDTGRHATGKSSTSSKASDRRSSEKPGRPAGGLKPLEHKPTTSHFRRKYFSEEGGAGGEHTRMIRKAYQQEKKKHTRKYLYVLAAVGVVLLFVAAYAVFQHVQNQRLEQRASEIFYEMRQQDMQLAQISLAIEEAGGSEFDELLAQMQQMREQMASRYEGYVNELGVHRGLNEEERLIYTVARIFNEGEFEMPAGFIRNVQQEIRDYWLAQGRSRFAGAIERAEENGYTPYIVRTMKEHGLPPEFFYLALQESNFQLDAVGPETRWGIAKGMWQFIPSTGRAYGLTIGPREDVRVFDDQDERHDVEASTVAAARYKAEIYSTLAQASGLLVMASYNWGENRIVSRLDQLFEGIPENPRERSYWRFLSEYEDRMPEETKQYVIRIFAAAVIGQNPRHFGFDFDNPLTPHIEEVADERLTTAP